VRWRLTPAAPKSQTSSGTVLERLIRALSRSQPRSREDMGSGSRNSFARDSCVADLSGVAAGIGSWWSQDSCRP